MRTARILCCLAFGLAWLGMASPSNAEPTGVIVGRIRYLGTRVAAPIHVPPSSVAACGKIKQSQALILGANKALVNAVVSVEGVPAGAPTAPIEISIQQKACIFEPHLVAVPVGSRLTFINTDTCLHNVHLISNGVTLGNIAMPIQGQHTKLPINILSKPGSVHFKCDVHSWMDGYVYVFSHPWFAVTDKSGAFRIAGVPPGTYDLKIQHEFVPGVSQKVTVTAGGEATVDVDLK